MQNLVAKHGHFSTLDSGAPLGSKDYTTLVVLHGFTWHSGIFKRILPLFQQFNTRIVLLNRRDYPGSVPFEEVELRDISSIKPTTPHAEALAVLSNYMKQRARELYDFLGLLIESEKLPMKGGLVLTGWSFGASWITALLANASGFSAGAVPLVPYIRRIVILDPPYHSLGYPPPEDSYNPLFHPSHAAGEGVKIFPSWVSGYYAHGDSASELEHRIPLANPPPTIQSMSQEDIESALYPSPANPGGSDAVLLDAGIQHGLFSALRKAVLYPSDVASSSDATTDEWSTIELRYVWCDHSVWEMPWGTWALKEELQEAKVTDRSVRPIQIIRLEGANHFAHWDQPERLLTALLTNEIPDGVVTKTLQGKSLF